MNARNLARCLLLPAMPAALALALPLDAAARSLYVADDVVTAQADTSALRSPAAVDGADGRIPLRAGAALGDKLERAQDRVRLCR